MLGLESADLWVIPYQVKLILRLNSWMEAARLLLRLLEAILELSVKLQRIRALTMLSKLNSSSQQQVTIISSL